MESITAHDSSISRRPPQQSPPATIRENIPLKNDFQLDLQGNASGASRMASNGRQLKVIVACMTAIAVLTAVALFAEVARDSKQLLVHRGTVYADVDECSSIGRRVLVDGGSAVDASIATFMCLAVSSPHLASLGCGGFMLIHEPGLNGDHVVVNFREVAPYHIRQPLDTITNRGAKVATAGVLRGLQIAHDRFGKLPWRRLVLPASKLAEDGFLVTDSLRRAVLHMPPEHPALVQLLLPNGVPVNVGDVVTWKTLASTLKTIAKEGPDAFYSGNLTNAMIDDLARQGSLLTRRDFESYSAVIDTALEIPIGTRGKLFVPPLPSSGLGLGLVLSMLATTFNDTATVSLQYHRLIEAIKIAMAAVFTAGSPLSEHAARMTSEDMFSSASVNELRAHIKDDSAIALNSVPALRMATTAAASVLVECEGILVALVGTLGSSFGSQVVASNGVLFNDAMEDFFAPTSDVAYTNNFYAPGRRPLSALAVAALQMEADTDVSCSVRLIGASANFQMLTQGFFDLLGMRREADSLTHILQRPTFLATLSRSYGGDVAVYGKTTGMSARLMDQLHQLGHIVYETEVPLPQIASLRQTGSTIEIYPNPSKVI